MRVPLSYCLVLFALMASLPSQQDLGRIASRCDAGQVEVDGRVYPFRLAEPLPELRDRPRPLLVFLHGAGERGDDNLSQLRWLPERLLDERHRRAVPCFVLAVQCPTGERWVDVPWEEREPRPTPERPSRAMRAVITAIDQVASRPGVDPARVYVTGLSMGGYGAWDLIARQPSRFAGALIVCGGGDPEQARRLVDLPIEVWHGDRDQAVPVARARCMARAFELAGVPLRYHELAGVGHDSWLQAYADHKDRGLAWLFAQDQRQARRGAFAQLAVVPLPGVVAPGDGVFRLRPGARCVVADRHRATAARFLDELDLAAVARPGCVADVVPKEGDLVIEVAPIEARWQLAIGAHATLTVADEAALPDGLAALWQALHTFPGMGAPHGRFAGQARERTTVRVPAVPGWTPALVRRLLRTAWLDGPVTLAFVGQPLPPAVRELSSRALDLGVELLEQAEGQAAAERPARSVRELLRRPPALVLELAGDTAAAVVAHAEWALPTTREAAAAADPAGSAVRPVPIAPFLSRLAARCR